MNYLLGIDAGTTAFKAALFDERGNEIASAGREYTLLTPAPDHVEFAPEDYWQALKGVVRETLDRAGVVPADIRALAIDSQGETLVCVDDSGQPLRNAIVWLDNRSTAEADLIRDEFGVERVYDVTGQPEVVATWPATKILWLKKNEPDVFRAAGKYLLLEDYLVYRLTGRYVAERSLLSSSLYLDIHEGGWWNEMLDAMGISPGHLPELRNSGEAVATLTKQAAVETGLSADTLVVTGTLDQVAGMVGAGNTGPGMATETTGSALALCVNVAGAPPFDPALKVPCHVHALTGKYCLVFWAQTAGMVLKWFRENFYESEQDPDIYRLMDRDAAGVAPGSDGLVMLPHLSGAACPEFDSHARGAFYGITLQHGRAHFVRAVLESIAYMLRKNLELLKKLGGDVVELRSLGGGARSPLWNQIKADVTGKTILTVNKEETACLGAAMLARVGAGLYDSIDAAGSTMVDVNRTFAPNPANRETYEKGYAAYLTLYENLKDTFVP